MLRLGFCLALAVCASAAEDPLTIVRRSVERDRKYEELIRQYTFLERQDQRQLDSKGAIKERTVRTWDITLLEGSPYKRLVARDDKPLPPSEEAREQEKLRANIEGRQKETPQQRQARMDDAHRREEKTRAPIRELPDAFDFRLVGEDKVDGLEVWVIEGMPRKGYKPRASMAFFFPKVRGTLWISKKDYQWVRLEAESIETISFGAILARVAKGAFIGIEQTRVNDEVWLPRRVEVAATARIALVKMYRAKMEYTYDRYRKFQAESRIVTAER